jgi:hypothetical protein
MLKSAPANAMSTTGGQPVGYFLPSPLAGR